MRFNEKIKGIAYHDKKTKRLVERLPKRSIAIIEHEDLDVTAAEMLISCQIKAVINMKTSMTGCFIHHGVETLLNANIPVYDITDSNFNINLEQKSLMISNDHLFYEENNHYKELCQLIKYDYKKVNNLKKRAKDLFSKQFTKFVKNTFSYGEKELEEFVNEVSILPTLRQFRRKEVLIVARGASYEKDLKAMRTIIKKRRMKTIAVDGAADGMLKIGMKPDFIIGDMDSITENALKCGAQLLVHSYRDGRAPGEDRVKSLQIPYNRFPFIGISEDVALIFAYCAGAKKLYTIGTRTSMNEFMEKGRSGMGSSILTKMKVGHAVVDLKGIHSLFDEENKLPNNILVFPAAAITFLIISFSGKLNIFVNLIVQWWSDFLIR